MTIKLFCLRHGATIANQKDCYRGWIDYPLDSEGKEAAIRSAGFLVGKGITKIVSSPMRRAIETAKIVNSSIHSIIVTDSRLRPLNVGNLSGKSRKEYPMDWYFSHRDIPIGTTGESLNQFNAIQREVFSDYLSRTPEEYPILIVCHNSNLIGCKNYLERTNEQIDDDVVDPGGVAAIDFNFKMKEVFGGKKASGNSIS